MGIKPLINESSRMIEGVRYNGNFVVEGNQLNVLEARKLPSNWTAQTSELYALNQALVIKRQKRNYLHGFQLCLGDGI
jgi:hypothetical protein